MPTQYGGLVTCYFQIFFHIFGIYSIKTFLLLITDDCFDAQAPN